MKRNSLSILNRQRTMAARIHFFSQRFLSCNSHAPISLAHKGLATAGVINSTFFCGNMLKKHRLLVIRHQKIASKSCFSTATSPQTTALIIGSSGCLGSSIVSYFYRHQIVSRIIGVDFVKPPEKKFLNRFISLDDIDRSNSTNKSFLKDLTIRVKMGLEEGKEEEEDSKLDTIICAAGGFIPTTDYSHHEDLIYGVEEMIRQNLFPVIMATHIAATKLKPGGLFVVIGAASALSPTPGLLAYGISKNAVHYVVQTLGQKGELIRIAEQQPTVVALLPSMLDTPANRANAPEGTDYSKWTKVDHIAEELGLWITTPDLRPNSGSLVKVFSHSKSSKAVFRLVR